MTWKTLGESLEAALASMMNEVGDEVAGTRLDACKLPKGTGANEGPGQVREAVSTQRRKQTAPVTTQPGNAPASPADGRGIDTANPSRSPSGVVSRPMLSVIEGGRPARGGGSSRAAYAQAGGGNPASNLKLVSAHAALRPTLPATFASSVSRSFMLMREALE